MTKATKRKKQKSKGKQKPKKKQSKKENQTGSTNNKVTQKKKVIIKNNKKSISTTGNNNNIKKQVPMNSSKNIMSCNKNSNNNNNNNNNSNTLVGNSNSAHPTGTDLLTTCLQAAKISILSVGSGDGSQQVSIVRQGISRLMVTFYDCKKLLLTKYPHAQSNLDYLQKHCRFEPRFQIDATKLHTYNYEKFDDDDDDDFNGLFDLIFFTFPHTGIPNNNQAQNIETNQALLRGFLNSASKILKPGGEIHITLKNGEHYDQWNLPALLKNDSTQSSTKNKDNGIGPLVLDSSHLFDKTMFPGYKHRLTVGMNGKLKEVSDEKKGAKVHVFRFQGGQDHHPILSNNNNNDKIVTILQNSPRVGWTDDEVRAQIVSILVHASKNNDNNNDNNTKKIMNVLDIRRNFDNDPTTPDTRQMNRILYKMEQEGFVKRHAPNHQNKKPQWEFINVRNDML